MKNMVKYWKAESRANVPESRYKQSGIQKNGEKEGTKGTDEKTPTEKRKREEVGKKKDVSR